MHAARLYREAGLAEISVVSHAKPGPKGTRVALGSAGRVADHGVSFGQGSLAQTVVVAA
jgi:hypothetical protein